MKKNLEQKSDSHKKSITEALINAFGGYPIGYGLGIIILPLSVGWIQEDPLVANLLITLVYAIVSFVRNYFLRRVFERLGVDDNFIKISIKLARRISNLATSKRSFFYRHYRNTN